MAWAYRVGAAPTGTNDSCHKHPWSPEACEVSSTMTGTTYQHCHLPLFSPSEEMNEKRPQCFLLDLVHTYASNQEPLEMCTVPLAGARYDSPHAEAAIFAPMRQLNAVVASFPLDTTILFDWNQW